MQVCSPTELRAGSCQREDRDVWWAQILSLCSPAPLPRRTIHKPSRITSKWWRQVEKGGGTKAESIFKNGSSRQWSTVTKDGVGGAAANKPRFLMQGETPRGSTEVSYPHLVVCSLKAAARNFFSHLQTLYPDGVLRDRINIITQAPPLARTCCSWTVGRRASQTEEIVTVPSFFSPPFLCTLII